MIPQPKAGKLLRFLHDYLSTQNTSIDTLSKVQEYIAYSDLISEPRNVLDHGFVRLVDYMGNDLSIVRAARVSYDADWRTGEDDGKDEKLISRLLLNRHTSPFECVGFTFEIKCPIFVARQWHRHRTWAYSELSARYAPVKEEYYMPAWDVIGKQADKEKQARDMSKTTQDDKGWAEEIRDLIDYRCDLAHTTYRALLERGCPREIARSVLPVGTYTRFFATVNLHNLLHFLSLRLDKHAQYEIRVYAEAILNIIRGIVPVTVNHWLQLNPQLNETHD